MTKRLKILITILLVVIIGALIYLTTRDKEEIPEIQLGGLGVRLEGDFNGKTTVQNFSSATPATYLTLTFDRTGQAGSKDFYILGSLNTGVITSLAAKPGARLVVNGVTIEEYTSGLTFPATAIGTTRQGTSFSFYRKVSLTNGVNTITIDVSSTSGVASVQAGNAFLLAIEASSDSYYGEDLGSVQCTGATTAPLSVASTTILAEASDQEMLFLWDVQAYHEDESNVDVNIRFSKNNGDTVYQKSLSGELDVVANNSIYYSSSGFAIDTVPAAGAPYGIEIVGGGSASETCANKASVIAIPTSDFPEYWTDSQAVRTGHRTAYTATQLSISQALATGDYVVFAGGVMGNENVNEGGGWQLEGLRSIISFVTHQVYNMEDRVSNAAINENFLNSYVYATTTYAGSYVFRVQGRGTLNNAATEEEFNAGYLFVGRIRSPGNAVPIVSAVANGPATVNVGAIERFQVYWTDEDAENNTQLLCKTNSVTPGASPSCPGGDWGTKAFSSVSPAVIDYTALVGDIGTQNFYAFSCDDEDCSAVEAGTFTVQARPDPSGKEVVKGGGIIIRNGGQIFQ